MTMIETIAFDFGNVLGFFDHYRTLGKLTAYTDLSAGEMYLLIFGDDLEDAFESARIDENTFVEEVRRRCRLRCDTALLTSAIEDIFSPNQPLCDLLPRLKERYKLVLGSNTNPIHSRRFRHQFAHWLNFFDALVLSHEIGARKPAGKFYEQVVLAAGCAPDRCVFIDDLQSNVAGAQACGLRGIVYRDIDSLEQAFRGLGIAVD
jgi:glucose-1-phosphatase